VINFENSIVLNNVSLRDVLEKLDKSTIGIVFLINEKEHLEGILTDGDCRRAILNGAHLNDHAELYMVRNFVFGESINPREENAKLLNDRIRHLPILNALGKIVDFISFKEFLWFPIMEPSLTGNELLYVTDCIRTNWISSQGSYVAKFEKSFSDYHNIPFSLTTSNGTTALHLAMMALGIGPGDEVIVPDLTFGASASSIIHCGAKPIFVDVSLEHWNIDAEKIEKAITEKTKAIMPVHLYGHSCDMDPILHLAKKYNLFIVEDCAEALGAKYKGKLVGTIGDIGCFSFFSNKVITTGEGGMIITAKKEIKDKIGILRDHGMKKERRYWHEVVGYNYRMTNIQAAIGVAQLEQISNFIAKRKKIAKLYLSSLKNIDGVILPPCKEWADNIYWLFSILIDPSIYSIKRDVLLNELNKEGIESRPLFYPLHIQPAFLQPGNFPNAERLSSMGISLPSSNKISEDEILKVCYTLTKILYNNIKK
jgi:perosamine synthetase